MNIFYSREILLYIARACHRNELKKYLFDPVRIVNLDTFKFKHLLEAKHFIYINSSCYVYLSKNNTLPLVGVRGGNFPRR